MFIIVVKMGKKKGGVRIKQVGPKGVGSNLNPLADLMIPPEEMINLPPKPDTNTMHFWPLRKYGTVELRVHLYNTYIYCL